MDKTLCTYEHLLGTVMVGPLPFYGLKGTDTKR